ncbi:Uncharacterized protein At4g26450 [Linum grandiflorum]
MHPRHRSPGNGYRSSGSMGMGFGGSRVPPDGGGRGGGHGFYNSEYRGFRNRGFGRGHGQQKHFQQSQSQSPRLPRRKDDIMMEAGRLAAEYLVSKGVLPQAALSGKWQNGSLKNMAGDYPPDFRQQEAPVQDGRVSAHSRLGGGPSDAGSGERRYGDEFNSRNQFRGRRRGEYSRSYSSEWVRDSGRSSSGSERNRESPEEEGHDDSTGRYEVQQQGSKGADDRMQVSNRSALGREKVEPADVESRIKKSVVSDALGSKASLSNAAGEKADEEIAKGSEDSADLNPENKELKVLNNDESKEQIVPVPVPEDSLSKRSLTDDDLSTNNGSDLSVFCNFGKVPTKIRSALTSRVSKVDQVSSNGGTSSETGLLKGSDDLAQDASFNPLVAVGGISEMNDLKDSNDELSKELHMQSVGDEKVGPIYESERGKCVRSHSFPDGTFDIDSEFETTDQTATYVRSSSVKERGEKRPAGDSDTSQQQKKARESLSSMVPVSNISTENIVTANEVVSLAQPLIPVTENILGRDLPEDITGSDEEYSQQKHNSPGSFKICDLNLMGASDIHDSQSNAPVLMYPPVVAAKKEAVNVDEDLSISNAKMPNEYVRHMSSGKEIEVIDLEDDSLPENEVVDNSQTKMEVAFSGTEGFSSNVQAGGEITDGPDEYDGLTISEFLNSFSNCTSVAEGINPLQNEIGLHNAEGTLGYDDSIYTSLEEIPLSFIPDWEQPAPQGFEKPF